MPTKMTQNASSIWKPGQLAELPEEQWQKLTVEQWMSAIDIAPEIALPKISSGRLVDILLRQEGIEWFSSPGVSYWHLPALNQSDLDRLIAESTELRSLQVIANYAPALLRDAKPQFTLSTEQLDTLVERNEYGRDALAKIAHRAPALLGNAALTADKVYTLVNGGPKGLDAFSSIAAYAPALLKNAALTADQLKDLVNRGLNGVEALGQVAACAPALLKNVALTPDQLNTLVNGGPIGLRALGRIASRAPELLQNAKASLDLNPDQLNTLVYGDLIGLQAFRSIAAYAPALLKNVALTPGQLNTIVAKDLEGLKTLDSIASCAPKVLGNGLSLDQDQLNAILRVNPIGHNALKSIVRRAPAMLGNALSINQDQLEDLLYGGASGLGTLERIAFHAPALLKNAQPALTLTQTQLDDLVVPRTEGSFGLAALGSIAKNVPALLKNVALTPFQLTTLADTAPGTASYMLGYIALNNPALLNLRYLGSNHIDALVRSNMGGGEILNGLSRECIREIGAEYEKDEINTFNYLTPTSVINMLEHCPNVLNQLSVTQAVAFKASVVSAANNGEKYEILNLVAEHAPALLSHWNNQKLVLTDFPPKCFGKLTPHALGVYLEKAPELMDLGQIQVQAIPADVIGKLKLEQLQKAPVSFFANMTSEQVAGIMKNQELKPILNKTIGTDIDGKDRKLFQVIPDAVYQKAYELAGYPSDMPAPAHSPSSFMLQGQEPPADGPSAKGHSQLLPPR